MMSMLSPKQKHNLSRIVPISLLWLLFSIVYALLERGILGTLDHYPATGNPYNFSNNILVTPLTAFLTGILIGTVEVIYLHQLFLKRTFAVKIIVKLLIYVTVLVVFLFVLTVIANAIELQTSVINEVTMKNTLSFFFSYSFWGVIMYIAACVSISLFYNEVSDNLGNGVLINFFTGKYHQPVEEERIFMFLDMKSSTTIAEAMGHVKYFRMLREYFADLTQPIINYYGEIYQYVGDEVVISWPLKRGVQMNNCIECFFAMKKELMKHHDKYSREFGLLPSFKAGLHVGKVTTGEIGVMKKEIIFTGDVLNTTARIQSLCNNYKVDLLISGQLIQLLAANSFYTVQSMGESELRGRDEKVQLFTIVYRTITN